jgi:hypothetical protein
MPPNWRREKIQVFSITTIKGMDFKRTRKWMSKTINF